ncbi:hypothetical protein [Streptomyces sp. NPDC090025]
MDIDVTPVFGYYIILAQPAPRRAFSNFKEKQKDPWSQRERWDQGS